MSSVWPGRSLTVGGMRTLYRPGASFVTASPRPPPVAALFPFALGVFPGAVSAGLVLVLGPLPVGGALHRQALLERLTAFEAGDDLGVGGLAVQVARLDVELGGGAWLDVARPG